MSTGHVLAQTGPQGQPSEPFVVSFGVVGNHHQAGPDFRRSARELGNLLLSIRDEHRAKGWLKWDRLGLLLVDGDGAQTSRTFDDGILDEELWERSLADLGARWESAILEAGSWGEVSVRQPAYGRFWGPDLRTLEAFVRCPSSGVADAASSFLDQLAAAAQVAGVQGGFVHVDSIADPYTAIVTSTSALGTDDFHAYVHGYYWGLLLTAEHLDRLGGLRRVRSESPCAIARPMPFGDGTEGALTVLTESPLAMNADLVLAWRQYLTPVRRPGYPGFIEYLGYPPLDRPLWLFEGAAVPIATPAILMSGQTAEMGAVPIVPGVDDLKGLDMVEVEPDFSDGSLAPDIAVCTLVSGPDFKREVDAALVAATVNAWYITGVFGRLHQVDGRLHWMSNLRDVEDPVGGALSWQIGVGTADLGPAIRLLAEALGNLAATTGRTPDGLISYLRIDG